MNHNMSEGKWREFKGDLQKMWGKITNDEWEQTKGDLKKIGGLVQQRMGISQEEATSKIDAMAKKYQTDLQDSNEAAQKKSKLF